MVKPRVVLVELFIAIASVGCESSTSPPDPAAPQRIAVEQVITADLNAADSVRRYSFYASDTGFYCAFVQALEGQSFIAIRDSITQSVRTSLLVSPGAGDLSSRVTSLFKATAGNTYIVEVRAFPFGGSARFRFQPHRVNAAPEHVANSDFATGDTVNGESIDDLVDIDDFTTSGNGDQILVLGIRALGAGPEGVSLTFQDPNLNILGGALGRPGEPGGLTGRVTLPLTRTYLVRVQNVVGALGRYTGPYRVWSYLVNRAPETRPAAVTVGQVVAGENIVRAGDVDEFRFNPPANTAFNVFMQSPEPAILLEALDTVGNVVGLVPSVPADTGLFAHATGGFLRPVAGSIRLRVRGESDRSIADTGSYRFYVHQINPLPEVAPATIAPGDTIANESIDLAGDVDEFSFSGNAGDELNLVFQRIPPNHGILFARVVNAAGSTIVSRSITSETDTSLYDISTGAFTLSTSGTYHLRLEGASDGGRTDQDVGPYRFFLYRINRQPESQPAVLALGDSISGELLDVPGDIDEFRVAVTDSSGANVVIELESPVSGVPVLAVDVIDSASNQLKGGALTGTPDLQVGTGPIELRPGTHIVRISSPAYAPVLRGAYRLWVYGFRVRPEQVSDTFAIGDTVSGESIEPWGDVDRLHFYGVRGQHVNFAFQGLGATSTASFGAGIGFPGSLGFPPNVAIVSPTAAATLTDHQSLRVDLPVTGWYDVQIAASNSIEGRGQYRFAVTLTDSLPETATAALLPGDSVGSEILNFRGDWDQFTVSATPGAELGVIFDGHDGSAFPFLYVRVRDPSTGDSLAGTVGQFRRFTGPFTVPPNGHAVISVFQPWPFYRACSDATCGDAFVPTVPFSFSVVPVNRAPETASSAYTVGDTLRAEAIATVGDFDEFSSSGSPAENLLIFFRMTAPPVGREFHGLTLEIIDPISGDTLAGRGAQTFGQEFWQIGSFQVPSGGNFIIRVRGTGTFGEDITTGPYEFFIQR